MEPKKQRRVYMLLIAVALSTFALCVSLEVVTVALGISYAAVDDETVSLIIQGVATGGVVILSFVFTAVFYCCIMWLNQIHRVEHLVNPAKRRSLKPLGTAVEVRPARVLQPHPRLPSDQVDLDTRLASVSDGGDELDAPILVMMSPDDITDGNSEDNLYLLDHLGGEMMKPFTTVKLRELSPPLVMLLLLSSISFLMGIMALVWGITLAYDFGFGDENVIWPYVTVEVIVGLVSPLLLYVGTILFAIVLDYVTFGRVDARKAVHSLLPSVQLIKASENEYWSIKDTFYFLIRKKPLKSETSSCTTAWDFSRATLYFVAIIGLSFGLATSYFMNRTIVDQVNTRGCLDDLHYDCFVLEEDNWVYVNCNDTETLARHSFIHCYTFLRFAIDNNPIASLAEAFAFYLATVALFGQVFGVVKILLRLRPSRLWGIWFILLGLIAIAIAFFLMGYQGSFSLHRDAIGCFQVLMVGAFFLIVGFLLFEAGLWEREKITPHHKPIELRLFKLGHRHELDKAIAENETDVTLSTAV